jgi:hypothetical protein
MAQATATLSQITVNDVTYVRADSVVPTPSGNRIVAVIDRGWIYAGDRYECDNGYIGLRNIVWVFNWETIGFNKVLETPGNNKANLRKVDPKFVIEIPPNSLIFQVRVDDNWGLAEVK